MAVLEELFLRTIRVFWKVVKKKKKRKYIHIYIFLQRRTPELLFLWILEFLIDDLLSCFLMRLE